jgi:hypothetical protein
MARSFVEGRAIRAWGITLSVIENAPLSLTFSFGSFRLRRRAFYFFGKLLPLFFWVTTAAREKENQQNNG